MIRRRIKNPVGRPEAKNKKIHPPRIKLTESSIEAMNEIAEMNGQCSLSQHYQKAIDLYVLVNK